MVAPSNKKNESIASMLARVSDYFKKTTSVVTTCSDERRAKCVFDRSMNLPEGWMVQTHIGKGKKPSTTRKDFFYLSPHGHLLKTKRAVEEYLKAIPKLHFGAEHHEMEHIEVKEEVAWMLRSTMLEMGDLIARLMLCLVVIRKPRWS